MNEVSRILFVSLNVRGIRDKTKRGKIFRWINDQKCHIAFLQESFVTKDLESIIKSEWNGACYFNNGTNHSKGVVILIHNRLFSSLISVKAFSRGDGRILALQFCLYGKSYFCINIYAPTKSTLKEKFFKTLKIWSNKYKNHNDVLLVGGDFNCVQNRKLDTRGISHINIRKRNLSCFQHLFNLIDVWRKQNPDKRQFTWRQVSLKMFSRLDYWLVPADFMHRVYSTDIRPALKCDHNAVSLTIKVHEQKRGKGIWKLNCSLLEDETYRTNVTDVIRKLKLEYRHLDLQQKWELCKIKIKEFSMKYAIDVNKKKKCYIVNLEKELRDLCENECNLSVEDNDRMKKLKNNIDKWYTYQCRGAFVRSREKWLEKGEKSNRYFLQLEKRRGQKKEIDSLEVNGKIQKDNILKHIHSYYTNLYSIDDHQYSSHDVFTNIDIHSLCEEEADSCEGLLTEAECWNSLKGMNNNKSPGSDGLTVEFYKCFWSEIKDLVLESLNTGFCNGELSWSQKQSVLTLMYKKGPKTRLGNWRPISLLNVDYKIAARALSHRLKRVINTIVSVDQSGFMKGRSATENVRLIQDIIDYCESEHVPGIIMFIDFKQAFDNVNHSFLFKTLEIFGFKDTYIKWIRTLYHNACGSVMNYGWLSENFTIEKGVRQGCPLSALLFIITAEILALKVNQNKDIKGIQVLDKNHEGLETEIKIAQYADDTVMTLSSLASVRHAMDEIKKIGRYAGILVNWDKSKIMQLSQRCDANEIEGLAFSNDPFKFLGIYVGMNIKEVETLNWEGKIDKIKRILDLWKMRHLTYYGKITVIKMLAASQIVYVATAVPAPKDAIKRINKLLYSFLWRSKTEKIRRNICINDVTSGGLGMIDLEARVSALRLSWIMKYLNCQNTSWKTLFSYWIDKVGGIPLCLEFNCHKKDMEKLCKTANLPYFYFDLLCTWSELKYVNIEGTNNIMRTILWNNSNIKIRNRMLHFKVWERGGIKRVHHVLNDGRWKNSDETAQRYGLPKMLFAFKFAMLKKAFPLVWLRKSQDVERDEIIDLQTIEISTGDMIDLSKLNTKIIYSLIVQKNKKKPYILNAWQQRLHLHADFNWSSVLQFKFHVVRNNKIREFNFKLLHMILPSRYNLCKWKILDYNTCEICNTLETTKHMMLECENVRLFWRIVSGVIFNLCGLNIQMTEQILILGYEVENSICHLVNLIINFAEYVIYRNHIKNLQSFNRTHARTLYRSLKYELTFYLNCKSIKRENNNMVQKLIEML